MGGPGSGRRSKLAEKDLEADLPAVTTTVETPPQKQRAPRKYEVVLSSGEKFSVLTKAEKDFYDRQRERYMAEFSFTASSDQADLDQLLFQELLDYRWTQWLARRMDYDNQVLGLVLEDQYRRNKNDAQRTIGAIKTRLGMTRASRQESTESVASYIENLRKRAKEFGVHRNNQVILVLTLFNRLSSIVGTFDRSNETERSKTGFETEEHIVDWIRETALPEYRELDKKWIHSSQKYWEGL